MKEKKIFNQASEERFEEAKIIGGNPNGIISYNQTPHPWAYSLYKKMRARFWVPSNIDITKDKINYTNLSPAEKRAYDLVLAQLIANDSIQTNQLMDKMNSYITSPVVNACLALQASEESNHSDSYAVMAEDICKDTKRIYYMHEEVPELYNKNQAVENMFAGLYKDGEEPTKEDLLICFAANQILERLIFPGGFVIIFKLADKLPGSGEMVREIAKDELSSHVELFKFIFRTCIEEEFKNIIPLKVIETIHDLIKKIVEIEITWIKFASEGLMGFSDRTIRIFIQNAANEICNNLQIPVVYPEEKDDPLNKLLRHNMRDGSVATRENFFTGNVTAYSKGSVKDDWE